MRYPIFLFDFDYTLADATEGIVASANHALQRLGFEPASREAIRRTVGLSLKSTCAVLTGSADAELAERFIAGFREKANEVMTANTILFPDTVSVLRQLKKEGAKIGIVTSKYHYRIVEGLEKFRVTELVDCIVGVEDVTRPKPDPEGVFRAAKQLGGTKEHVLYIGDSLVDAETAANAGVKFLAVTTGTTTAEEFAAFPCIAVVENLSGLLKYR